MNTRSLFASTLVAVAILGTSGCAVMRDQQTVGAFIDDTTITTQIKARFFDNKDVAGTAISVETLNGTVLLSGFAKSNTEKATADRVARGVNGVKSLRNEIVVRP